MSLADIAREAERYFAALPVEVQEQLRHELSKRSYAGGSKPKPPAAGREHSPSCPRAQAWDHGEHEAPCTCRYDKPPAATAGFEDTTAHRDMQAAFEGPAADHALNYDPSPDGSTCYPNPEPAAATAGEPEYPKVRRVIEGGGPNGPIVLGIDKDRGVILSVERARILREDLGKALGLADPERDLAGLPGEIEQLRDKLIECANAWNTERDGLRAQVAELVAALREIADSGDEKGEGATSWHLVALAREALKAHAPGREGRNGNV